MLVHVAAKYYSCCVRSPPWINRTHLCELNALITMQVFIIFLNLFIYVNVGCSTIFFVFISLFYLLCMNKSHMFAFYWLSLPFCECMTWIKVYTQLHEAEHKAKFGNTALLPN